MLPSTLFMLKPAMPSDAPTGRVHDFEEEWMPGASSIEFFPADQKLA
jgi:hypothetical protein